MEMRPGWGGSGCTAVIIIIITYYTSYYYYDLYVPRLSFLSCFLFAMAALTCNFLFLVDIVISCTKTKQW